MPMGKNEAKQDAINRELIRGSAEMMVLSVLVEGAQYGYEIQKRVAEASDRLIQLKAGTLYPLLHRLEADGLIRAKWEKTTGRDRKWYELTAAGRRQLKSQASQWASLARCVEKLVSPAVAALADPA